MFGATNIGRDNAKSKYLHSDYGIAFDRKGKWNFGNAFARKVIIFGVDTNNRKNDFLVLGEGDAFGNDGSFGSSEKKLSINFSKAKIKFNWVCITMVIIVICLLTEKIYKFKANNKNVNFPNQFCIGRISHKFDYVEAEEVSLKGNMYDFADDYGAIDKSDILDMHKHSMVKNYIKNV